MNFKKIAISTLCLFGAVIVLYLSTLVSQGINQGLAGIAIGMLLILGTIIWIP